MLHEINSIINLKHLDCIGYLLCASKFALYPTKYKIYWIIVIYDWYKIWIIEIAFGSILNQIVIDIKSNPYYKYPKKIESIG